MAMVVRVARLASLRSASPTANRSIGGSIVHGALAILSTQPLTWAASLLTLVYVPRLLGADAFGQYTVVTTIATMAGTAFGLGVPDYLVRHVAQRTETAERDVGMAMLTTLFTTLFGALVVAIAVPLLGFPIENNQLLWVALLGVLAVPAQGGLFAWLRGHDDHVGYAWWNAASVVLWAVLGLLALVGGASVLVYTLIGALVPTGISLLAFRLGSRRPSLPRPDFGEMRAMVLCGIPFLGCTLTQVVASTVDRVILGGLVPASVVGWYAAANRIVYIPIFVPHLVSTPLFAAVSRHSHDPVAIRRAITESVRIVLLLTVPLAAGLVVIAPIIPGLVGWPEDFVNTVPLMQVLAVSMPLMSANTVIVSGLMALGFEGKWARASFVVALSNIAINIACIPWFQQNMGNGAIGAAAVTGATELLMFCAVLILIPRAIFDPKILWIGVRVALAGCLSGIAAAVLMPIALPLSALAGVTVYAGSALLVKVLSVSDLRMLASRRLLA
jgi:O-antigen/teichoic acid export membrane protein